MFTYVRHILFSFILCASAICFGVTIGPDDTTVGYFSTSQSLSDGDRIGHFAALSGGFALSGSSVSATFDAVFPVDGTVSLNTGTLALTHDLILHNVANINTLGDITGNGHVFSLSKMECFPEADPDTACSVTFTDDIVLVDVLPVDWSYDSAYVVAGRKDNIGDQVYVYAWDGATLSLEDSVSVGDDVFSVAWHPTNDWIAVGGKDGAGDELYTYTFSRATSTLTQLDSVAIGDDVKAVVWHPDGGHLGIASKTNDVIVYVIDSSGNFGASTTVALSEEPKTLDWNSDGSFLVVGTKDLLGWDELRVYSFTKSPLGISLDASFDTAEDTLATAWNKSSNTDVIAVGLKNGADRLRLFRHSVGSLTEIITTEGALAVRVNSAHWKPSSGCLTLGLNDNVVGPGGEIRTFSFASDDLTFVQSIEVGSDIESVRWSPNGSYLATGDKDGGTIRVYTVDSGGAGPFATSIFTDLQLLLNSDITLRNPISFAGQSVIDGNGYILTLASTSSLAVAAGGTLLMKDITVKGIHENHIQLSDSSSTFSFHDTTFVLDGDFTFSTGKFEVVKDFMIEGDGHVFVYSSDQVSTIRGGIETGTVPCDTVGFCGRMILDHGVTFSYNSSSADRLQFEDRSSQMMMNSATLAALTSIELITGRLVIDGKSYFTGSNSVTIGDGMAANNLCIEWLPAGNLVVRCELIDKNV